MNKIIAIIPARGGSKRIPGKNIKNFCGKPIIEYTIKAAQDAQIFDKIVVSTDDLKIAEIAKNCGANIPYIRNKDLANDYIGTAPVIIDILNYYNKIGFNFNYSCCLYATAPFIKAKNVRNCMEILLKNPDADSVLPVVKYSYPPQRGLIMSGKYIKMKYPENYNMRSQDLESIFHDCGQFYCLKTETLKKESSLYCGKTIPFELPELEVQDIDTEDDWKLAEIKFKMLNFAD